MGRPIKKKYMNGGNEPLLIEVIKWADGTTGSGVLVKQVGTSSFLLSDTGTRLEKCTLANVSSSEDLNPGEFIIQVEDYNSNPYNCKKIMGHRVSVYATVDNNNEIKDFEWVLGGTTPSINRNQVSMPWD